jgi:hypothetical protein
MIDIASSEVEANEAGKSGTKRHIKILEVLKA